MPRNIQIKYTYHLAHIYLFLSAYLLHTKCFHFHLRGSAESARICRNSYHKKLYYVLFSRHDNYEMDHQINRVPSTFRGRKVTTEQEGPVAASGGQWDSGQGGQGSSRRAVAKADQPEMTWPDPLWPWLNWRWTEKTTLAFEVMLMGLGGVDQCTVVYYTTDYSVLIEATSVLISCIHQYIPLKLHIHNCILNSSHNSNDLSQKQQSKNKSTMEIEKCTRTKQAGETRPQNVPVFLVHFKFKAMPREVI